MTGIIFAAGIGTRLKPFTDSHPKALAEIHGTPALVGVARKLLKAGADRLIINIHHFPEQIIECVAGQDFSALVTFSDESDRLLDTGGGLAKIVSEHPEILDKGPVVVHNADIYTDFPIKDMVARHIESGADATLLVDSRRESTRHFLFDKTGSLKGWENTLKNTVRPEGTDASVLTAAAFGGVHVLSAAVMQELGKIGYREPFSITDWYIDNCRKYKICAYTPVGAFRWHDIGTPEKLAAANLD
ncbi:MAG: NTP transferase domain-containing protein [Muribaculaceae bacterium]|nr:NTP transferase domain-containing protein [Muribaculaceae bacterium]